MFVFASFGLRFTSATFTQHTHSQHRPNQQPAIPYLPARAMLAPLLRVIWRQLRLNRRRNCSNFPQPRFGGAATSCLEEEDLAARPARRFWMAERRLGTLALWCVGVFKQCVDWMVECVLIHSHNPVSPSINIQNTAHNHTTHGPVRRQELLHARAGLLFALRAGKVHAHQVQRELRGIEVLLFHV